MLHAHSAQIIETPKFLNKIFHKRTVVYVTLCLFHSDSVEREDTLGDNSIQLQSFIQYEPDLFVSR